MRSILAAAAFTALIGIGGATASAAPSVLSGLPALSAKADVEPAQYRRGARCIAVGVTINGRRIRGVRGVGRGRFACRQAIRQCNYDLRRRKFSGRNPLGRCVVRG